MLTIGVDAHKRVLVAVALDHAGREVAHWRGENTAEGWRAVAAWSATLADTCQWGVEGCPGYLPRPRRFLVPRVPYSNGEGMDEESSQDRYAARANTAWHAAISLTPAGVRLSDPSGEPHGGQRARARTCFARAVVPAHQGTAARRPAQQLYQLIPRRGRAAHVGRGSCAFAPKLDSFVNLPPYEDVLYLCTFRLSSTRGRLASTSGGVRASHSTKCSDTPMAA